MSAVLPFVKVESSTSLENKALLEAFTVAGIEWMNEFIYMMNEWMNLQDTLGP